MTNTRPPGLGMAALLAALHVSLVMLAPAAPAPAADSQIDVVLADDAWAVPPELTFRARVTALTPSEPTDLAWRQGGEGLGGGVTHGVLGEKLDVGQWSPAVPVASLVPQGKFPKVLFVTFTAGRGGKLVHNEEGRHTDEHVMSGASKDVRDEFEFRFRDKVIKQFAQHGPNGGTVGVVIPAGRLVAGKTP